MHMVKIVALTLFQYQTSIVRANFSMKRGADAPSILRAIIFSFPVVFVFLLGCAVVVPYPLEEFTLARAALTSAKDSGAERLASGYWYKAEENYQKAQKSLKDKDNELARSQFLKAIDFAEKAENASRLKKFESGEPLQ